GMVMVSPRVNPTICSQFEASIVLLFHANTFRQGSQVTVHLLLLLAAAQRREEVQEHLQQLEPLPPHAGDQQDGAYAPSIPSMCSQYLVDCVNCWAAVTASSGPDTRKGTLLQPGCLRTRCSCLRVRCTAGPETRSTLLRTRKMGTFRARARPRCSRVVPARRRIREGERLLVGPTDAGGFLRLRVGSIQRNRSGCRLLRAGQAATLALGNFDRSLLRKGMVMVSPRVNPTICSQFEASIVLLFHANTFRQGSQVTVHVGNVRQTATVLTLQGKEALRTGERAVVRFGFLKHAEYLRLGAKLLFREGVAKGIGHVAGYIAFLLPTADPPPWLLPPEDHKPRPLLEAELVVLLGIGTRRTISDRERHVALDRPGGGVRGPGAGSGARGRGRAERESRGGGASLSPPDGRRPSHHGIATAIGSIVSMAASVVFW
ncbi:hypothetical protein CRUP_007828, partial [Coryphaenoides rupestris]